MTDRPGRRERVARPAAAVGLLALVTVLIVRAAVQLPPDSYFLHDQRHYLALAERPLAHENLVPAPFRWRLMPSLLVHLSGLDPQPGFDVLTIGSLVLSPMVLLRLLLAAGASRTSAAGGAAALAMFPPVAGHLAWDTARVDAPALLLLLLAMLATVQRRMYVLVAALILMALTKETVVLACAFAMLSAAGRRDGMLLRAALGGTAAALVMLGSLRLLLPAEGDVGFVHRFLELYTPVTARTVGQRVLLATAATWNVLLPIASTSLARLTPPWRSAALGVPIVLATAQVLVAIDTERVVAVAFPFVVIAAALEIDRWQARSGLCASHIWAGILAAQVPWLALHARVVSATAVYRVVEVALWLLSATLAAVVLWGTRRVRLTSA